MIITDILAIAAIPATVTAYHYHQKWQACQRELDVRKRLSADRIAREWQKICKRIDKEMDETPSRKQS